MRFDAPPVSHEVLGAELRKHGAELHKHGAPQ